MILFPHTAVLLHEFLLLHLTISKLFFDVFAVLLDLFGFVSYQCTHLLFRKKSFLGLVLFEEFLQLILLFVEFILQLLIGLLIRIYQFLSFQVIFCHFLGEICGFLVQGLNLDNLRHRDTHALHVVVIGFHVFKFGYAIYDKFG